MFGSKTRKIQVLQVLLQAKERDLGMMDKRAFKAEAEIANVRRELDQTAKWLFEANEKIQPLIAERDQLHRRVEELEATRRQLLEDNLKLAGEVSDLAHVSKENQESDAQDLAS